jgi:Na+-driven multidrug efflux pump
MMPTLLGLIAMTSGSLVDGMFIGNYIERDGETLALALEFVAYIWPVFIFAGFTMWISGYLKAVHLPFQSALVASCRSLIMPAGFLILFYMMLSDYRFVAAISAAEAISFVIEVTLFIYHTPTNIIRGQG